MRPAKTTVEYFPHMTRNGKTIFSLQSRYGNDGYALWFKTLELLGAAPGHFININDKAGLHYLSAYFGVSEEKTHEVLRFLSELNAIDPDLYSEGIIWSENFVSNLKPVYDKRKTNLPDKPCFSDGKWVSGEKTTIEQRLSPQRDPKTTQSKGKESKRKNNTANEFDRFWEVWPKKVDKKDALKVWKSLGCNEHIDSILSAIFSQKKTDQWRDRQYIPGPAKWLRGEKWNDEVCDSQGGQQEDQKANCDTCNKKGVAKNKCWTKNPTHCQYYRRK